MLTGAVIAAAVDRPLVTIPCALLSHFVVDAIPHFGFEEEDVIVRNKSKLFKRVVAIDAACAVAILILLPLLAVCASAAVQAGVVVICMVAALSPDLVWVRMFLREVRSHRNIEGGRFSRFHKRIQWSESKSGIYVEYAWAVGMLLLFGALI